ncbi:MAG: helix-turn-helix domain-containing protein [Methanobacteriaceae archaeon]|nr:helix-turn-helix domain-containing protein [Methanobacteriaceae archaeon]
MKDQKTKTQFIELRAQGLSYKKIAKKLNVSKTTLIKWGKEFENEISNAKAIELETLYHKYYMVKEKRITLFGDLLETIREELESRDLSDIPTERLFNLMIKYSNYLKKEINELVFREKMEKVDMMGGKYTIVNEWKAE